MSEAAFQQNEYLKNLIRRVKVDEEYMYDTDLLLDQKVKFMVDHCNKVVDFGQSSRDRYSLFDSEKIITSDINDFGTYPDVIDDICNIQNLDPGSFDGVICMAVLEHVYAPHLACENIYNLLEEGGHCLIYVPFLYRYHALKDLGYQDYFRFTRDGLAYLFKDFSEVTIYPVRGRLSTAVGLFEFWKNKVERLFGQKVNRILDFISFSSKEDHALQASGYILWAKK